MPGPIDINSLKGIMQKIAQSCDINHDGKLETCDDFDEISLFNKKVEDFNNGKLATSSIFGDYYVAPSDNTRVERPVIADELVIKKNVQKADDATLKKSIICQKMKEKWCKAFKNSPLKEEFFSKLYDVIDILNIKISEKAWDKKTYSSPKEQAMDEMIAMFAGEAQLNPGSIKYRKGKPIYYGLFQADQDALGTIKAWAKKHPEVPGMANIDQNMTLQKFRKLSGEQQLDYFVAHIGSSRDNSHIPKNESLSPAKVWSMVKLPNLNENISEKKARRDRTTIEKQDSIARVFRENKIQRGIT